MKKLVYIFLDILDIFNISNSLFDRLYNKYVIVKGD